MGGNPVLKIISPPLPVYTGKIMPQDSIKAIYEQLRQDYALQYEAISRKHNNLSISRLLTALLAITGFYLYFKQQDNYMLGIAIALVVLFVFLMQWHGKTSRWKIHVKTLLQINEEELAYLGKGLLPFGDGTDYKEDNHAYANDLDLFGPRSLYQHLNRTATQMGKNRLAEALLHLQPAPAIRRNQEAIAELEHNLKERQELYARARIAGDNKDIYERLIRWAAQEEKPVSKLLLLLCYLLPLLLLGSLLFYAITRTNLYWDIATKLFPVNLFVFFFQLKRIRKAMFGADKVNELLKEYAAILLQIEQTEYKAAHLKALQEKLKTAGTRASLQIKKLASIYAGLETVQNPFAAVITNGLYCNHIHVLHRLSRWKKEHAASILLWLEVIGEMEMLNSLANLRYNNPSFCFPELNEEYNLSFKALGHPLIPASKRVCNDVTFDQHRFVILTGSNMSGKSTFLRTLGVNMVLAGAGSAICASGARIHPLPVFVSMRQSDSLADSESYFFAEVKRLKYIMEQLDKEVCFVLLDEILRGTNSDDKRSGTIGVIEKIIRKKAIGAIATHDLEVCLTTDAHPGILSNKCFEVEIINDELVFDYKLRTGICQNKSATFLMKKMEIIG